jgi:hypothetical protein
MGIDNDCKKKVYQKKEEIIARKIADETILVPIRGKLADMQKIFSLNPVAEFIWMQLEQKIPVEDILSMVINEFDVEEKKAEEDLLELINEFLKENLIKQVA